MVAHTTIWCLLDMHVHGHNKLLSLRDASRKMDKLCQLDSFGKLLELQHPLLVDRCLVHIKLERHWLLGNSDPLDTFCTAFGRSANQGLHRCLLDRVLLCLRLIQRHKRSLVGTLLGRWCAQDRSSILDKACMA